MFTLKYGSDIRDIPSRIVMVLPHLSQHTVFKSPYTKPNKMKSPNSFLKSRLSNTIKILSSDTVSKSLDTVLTSSNTIFVSKKEFGDTVFWPLNEGKIMPSSWYYHFWLSNVQHYLSPLNKELIMRFYKISERPLKKHSVLSNSHCLKNQHSLEINEN